MALSDQQLMLLEQLTYFTGEVQAKAGAGNTNGLAGLDVGATVEDLLESVLSNQVGKDEKTPLERLDGCTEDVGSLITGEEWAAVLRAIQQDDELMSMKLVSRGNSGEYCFESSEGEAVVTFRGTYNGEEWYDNVEGLNQSDTKCQREALDFIESLPYDDITVAGHSKGGNKAMYVTVVSDKVNRCVSMDGQGFSQEFLDKYAAEIEANGGKISNYSLSTDYVHILLFPVPGSSQYYISGDASKRGARNHSPGAFYQYYQDENGNWQVRMNAKGDVALDLGAEHEAMTYLHEFTCFVLNVMPDAKKNQVVSYLAAALSLAEGESSYKIEVDGKVYTKDQLMNFLLSDPESLELVIAYLMKYKDTYGLSWSEIEMILDAFGFTELLNTLKEGMIKFAEAFPRVAAALGIGVVTTAWVLEFFYKQLTDGKRDLIIEKLLEWLGGWLSKTLGKDIDVKEIWVNIEAQYTAIGDVDVKTANQNGTVASTKTYDFSRAAYDKLISVMNAVNAATGDSLSSWSAYAGEDWYNSLSIGAFRAGINAYYSHLGEIQSNCKDQIDRIFTEVGNIDKMRASNVKKTGEELEGKITFIQQIAGRIGN